MTPAVVVLVLGNHHPQGLSSNKNDKDSNKVSTSAAGQLQQDWRSFTGATKAANDEDVNAQPIGRSRSANCAACAK